MNTVEQNSEERRIVVVCVQQINNKYLIIRFADVCANGSESDSVSIQVNGSLYLIFTGFWLDFANRFYIPTGFFKGGY